MCAAPLDDPSDSIDLHIFPDERPCERCVMTRLTRAGLRRQEERGARVSNADSEILDDVRIGVRLKIAALWIAMLFLFAYGDIFGFFNTGRIEEITAGELSGMKITQGFLFAVSVYVAIASVMI